MYVNESEIICCRIKGYMQKGGDLVNRLLIVRYVSKVILDKLSNLILNGYCFKLLIFEVIYYVLKVN